MCGRTPPYFSRITRNNKTLEKCLYVTKCVRKLIPIPEILIVLQSFISLLISLLFGGRDSIGCLEIQVKICRLTVDSVFVYVVF